MGTNHLCGEAAKTLRLKKLECQVYLLAEFAKNSSVSGDPPMDLLTFQKVHSEIKLGETDPDDYSPYYEYLERSVSLAPASLEEFYRIRRELGYMEASISMYHPDVSPAKERLFLEEDLGFIQAITEAMGVISEIHHKSPICFQCRPSPLEHGRILHWLGKSYLFTTRKMKSLELRFYQGQVDSGKLTLIDLNKPQQLLDLSYVLENQVDTALDTFLGKKKFLMLGNR